MYWNTQTILDKTVGKVIESVSIRDNCILILSVAEPDDRQVKQRCSLLVEGDCCSDSWFSDIYDVPSILGKTITGIEDASNDPRVLGYNFDDGRSTQDSDQIDAFYIVCGDSKALIIYRNSSNGYYGSYLSSYNDKKDLPYTGKIIDSNVWQSTFKERL